MSPEGRVAGLHPLSLLLFVAGAVVVALAVYNYLTGGKVSASIGIGLASIFLGLYLNRSAGGRKGQGL